MRLNTYIGEALGNEAESVACDLGAPADVEDAQRGKRNGNVATVCNGELPDE